MGRSEANDRLIGKETKKRVPTFNLSATQILSPLYIIYSLQCCPLIIMLLFLILAWQEFPEIEKN